MPTEHEFKYVISLDFAKEQGSLLRDIASEVQHIRQGYVAFSKGMTTRVRSIQKRDKKPKWFFTFKQKICNRTVEIETKIDRRDGHDLWQICVGKLKKTRYIVDHQGVSWEIDLFHKGHGDYFVLAEVELDEGSKRPDVVPPILQGYVLYEVPLNSDEFSNKRLGDVEYAKEVYDRLTREITDENEETKGLRLGSP